MLLSLLARVRKRQKEIKYLSTYEAKQRQGEKTSADFSFEWTWKIVEKKTLWPSILRHTTTRAKSMP